MNVPRPRHFARPPGGGICAVHGQRGTALVVAMLFLVLISLLGMTSITTTTLEERMSSNAQDQNIALQVAEAALADAEIDLRHTSTGLMSDRVIDAPLFSADCAPNGLCALNADPNYRAPLVNMDDPNKSSRYGQHTAQASGGMLAFKITDPALLPRYMIEIIKGPLTEPGPPSVNSVYYFRITSKAYGASRDTSVILQTVYKMQMCPGGATSC